MDRIIEVKVNGNYITKDSRRAGVQGECNVTSLRIEFDEGWNGFAKTITWWDAMGENPVKIVLGVDLYEDITNSTLIYLCPIPGEALMHAGECYFVIDGIADDQRQRSVQDYLTVLEADYTDSATEPADPTPTLAEQLQAEIESIVPSVQEQAIIATEAAESAAENAAKAQEAAGSITNEVELAQGYAESAAASAIAAETSKAQIEQATESAAQSAEKAATSERNAAASASSVAASVESATASANAAAASASAASESASSAANSASVASAAKGNLESAVQSATASATSASSSASKASASATAAQTAQTAAEKARDEAQAAGSGDMLASVYDPQAKKTDIFDYVDDKIAAIPTPDVSAQITSHNTSSTAHSDIRTIANSKSSVIIREW